jgi:hypothetical protein
MSTIDDPQVSLPDHDTVELRMLVVSQTLSCPYCEARLKKWMVPQHPWNEWPNDFFYVCFNDDCPYFLRGWKTLAAKGGFGSYRLRYDTLKDHCSPIPVFDARMLRDGISD